MEFDITQMIEKTLKDLLGGKRGDQAAKLYRKYWNPINYAIIGAIGVGINYIVQAPLQNLFEWWLANAFGIGAAFLWNWSMSVGPFCRWWGFKKQDLMPVKPEAKKK